MWSELRGKKRHVYGEKRLTSCHKLFTITLKISSFIHVDASELCQNRMSNMHIKCGANIWVYGGNLREAIRSLDLFFISIHWSLKVLIKAALKGSMAVSCKEILLFIILFYFINVTTTGHRVMCLMFCCWFGQPSGGHRLLLCLKQDFCSLLQQG